jgi:prepilin-type processing-associated H-X9-DG protein
VDESLAHAPAPPISRGAVAAFVLGVASLLLLFLTGVPAMWLGLRALRSINIAEGRQRGRRLAVAGIALGGLGCIAAMLGLAVIVFTTLRVRSQRVECENNLRRIGAAVLNYHTANNHYPPGVLANAALPPEKRLSWLAQLPPYLEQKASDAQAVRSLYDRLDPSLAWDADPNLAVAHTAVPLFRCPAHLSIDPHPSPGNTDYVGMAGVGPNAAALPLSDPMAGVFGYDRTVRDADLTAGTSQTLLALETTRDNGPWAAGGPATVRGLDPGDAPYIGPSRAFGGAHPDGLNALFADGSSRFMRDDVSPRFLETVARVNRGDVVNEPRP